MTRHWTQRRPLWAQILALTVFVLLLPAVGFLLLNRFGQELIEAETQAVKAEATALAAALELAAIDIDAQGQARLEIQRARALIVAHANQKSQNTRVRLFDQDGGLLLDSERLGEGLLSSQLIDARVDFEAEPLLIKSFVPTLSDFGIYEELGFNDSRRYAEVSTVLATEQTAAGVYSDRRAGRFRVLGAASVSHVQTVLGAILVDHLETGIEQSLRTLNQRMALIFLIAFLITIFVSLVLAWLIASPVTRLSNAARRLTAREASAAQLPLFANRRDEIGDLSLALRDMARALTERADASEAFAAEVAHELKNPLTSLRSAAETLSIVKDEGKRARLLAVLTEDTDRLDRLISDISASSRLDAELARQDPERTDLVQTVRTFMEGQGLVDPQGMGAVRVAIAMDSALWVRASETQLIQVIINLLTNALSFSPEPSSVILRLSSQGRNTAQMTVSDRGPGIPADKLETIFKRFFTDREAEFGRHSGLGLSIVQRIVESGGGRIHAENRETGTGAIFTISMPLV